MPTHRKDPENMTAAEQWLNSNKGTKWAINAQPLEKVKLTAV